MASLGLDLSAGVVELIVNSARAPVPPQQVGTSEARGLEARSVCLRSALLRTELRLTAPAALSYVQLSFHYSVTTTF